MHRTRNGYHFSVMQDPLANAVAIPHPPPVLNPTSGGRISMRLGRREHPPAWATYFTRRQSPRGWW